MEKPIGSKHETDKHFIVKSIVYKLLRNKGNKPHFEADLGVGYADVFDESTGYVYEVETVVTQRKALAKLEQYKKYALVQEVIVIPLNKVWDDNINKLIKNLKEWII